MWRVLLENDVVLFERSFELIGAFIIKDVEFGVKPLN
jgi:hypothetical protein